MTEVPVPADGIVDDRPGAAEPAGGVPPLDGAIQIAGALAYAGFEVRPVGAAVVSAEVYPQLTAYQLGLALLDPTAFPNTTSTDMITVLMGTARYTQAEVQAAVEALYRGVLPIGPVGGGTYYYGPPVPFDDLAFALAGAGPITGFVVRAGAVVDAVTAYFGGGLGPRHGGDGGQPYDVRFAAGDLLQQVTGFVGTRWGSVYIVQLSFVTRSGARYGPYGPSSAGPGDTPFDLSAGAGHQIIALYGQTVLAQRYNAPPSDFVNQLGAYTKPG